MCEDQNVNPTVDDFSTMRNLGGWTTWVVTVDYPGQRKNLKLLTTRLGQPSSFSFFQSSADFTAGIMGEDGKKNDIYPRKRKYLKLLTMRFGAILPLFLFSAFADLTVGITERRVISMARTWKQIEASREARLWIGQVIIPVVTAGIAIVAYQDEVRDGARDLYQKAKGRITRLFHKKS